MAEIQSNVKVLTAERDKLLMMYEQVNVNFSFIFVNTVYPLSLFIIISPIINRLVAYFLKYATFYLHTMLAPEAHERS